MKNFKPTFIDDSSNILISVVKDLAATDMHAYAMHLLKKQQSSSVVDYVPIAKCFTKASMDQSTLAKTKKKFDISYMIAKEKLAFTKMKPICELEERHGVDLGVGYRRNHSLATFVSFIAKEQINCLLNSLSKTSSFLPSSKCQY